MSGDLGLEDAIRQAISECDLTFFDTSALGPINHNGSRHKRDEIRHRDILLKYAPSITISRPVLKELERRLPYIPKDEVDSERELLKALNLRTYRMPARHEKQFEVVKKQHRQPIRNRFHISHQDYHLIALTMFYAERNKAQTVAMFSNDIPMIRALDFWSTLHDTGNVHIYTALWSRQYKRFNNGH